MKVILLDNISNLGNLGEQVNVKAGYARNFLIPQGKVVVATKENIKHFDISRVKLEAKLADIQANAELRAAKINKLGHITMLAKAGNEGKLFGSIGTRKIAEAITVAGVKVAKNEVRLPNGVLRTTGNHCISIHVYNKIFTSLNVIVLAEKYN